MLSNCGIAQDTTFQIVEKKAMQIKGLAKSAEKTGNPYIALEYYKELVALKPEKDRYLLKLANLYMYTRNYVEAAKCFKQIIEKGGDDKMPNTLTQFFSWLLCKNKQEIMKMPRLIY